MPQTSENKIDQEGQLEVIELELDEHGSPVALEPAGWFVCIVPGLAKQWWHRLLMATITSEQARKFLIWGARGDVLHVRETIPGRGSQVRGWMTCATLASFLLGRKYWVWTPHGLYKLLLREPNVCRVDASALVKLDAAKLAEASKVIMACDERKPGGRRRPGAPKPFCMNCGRDL